MVRLAVPMCELVFNRDPGHDLNGVLVVTGWSLLLLDWFVQSKETTMTFTASAFAIDHDNWISCSR